MHATAQLEVESWPRKAAFYRFGRTPGRKSKDNCTCVLS